ncbi:hypothetical protein ABB37_08682 [Leptomonas pyrrhocoris]|uniref:Uncharacterized protein n=1 Tax=Leptomonas pyrrhocoris TaxID=157538 RepID=A0A0N0DS05_LEPPY|nr:hypothetical protein ABB37_08682 [Leptomonas pyrrhocoris]KPA75412.1 hypothetical protein ABB37_08682 [Leptomonas pyrrhocoris]|eukprot:XP_015653851.1 hypothetical protein ABB37_08682 [Leptomonas pyrrhocoris]
MAEDERLAATKRYEVAAVQQEYAGCSPLDAYVRICKQLHCTPVASVKGMLPCEVGAWGDVESLDFANTYVGPHGAVAVVELCRCLPRLRSLNLADNYLSNNTVWHLAQMAVYHPQLEWIDLSKNEFISWTGAMCLAELALRNANITHIDVHGAAIEPDIAEAISAQTRQNTVAKFRAGSGRPCPPVHPAAVYIRALKLLFLKHQEQGKVDAALLETGFTELLRVSGRASESSKYSEKVFATLRARAPAGVLTAEAVLILLLIDGSTYDVETVTNLRRVFVMFNIDVSPADPLVSGFVLARDLADMMEYIYGARPSAADVAAVQRRLALAEETTLKWEEFLYLTYPRGPQVGDRLCGVTSTPLAHPIEVMHY